MAKRESVNVWFDNPGNFLEIGWGEDAVDAEYPHDTELDPTVFVNSENQITSFHIIGALSDRRDYVEESYIVSDAQSHPLTVKYDRDKDLWDVHWGHAAVDCVVHAQPADSGQGGRGGADSGRTNLRPERL